MKLFSIERVYIDMGGGDGPHRSLEIIPTLTYWLYTQIRLKINAKKKTHKKRENRRVFLKREGSLKCNQIRFIISARLCSLRIDFVYKFVCVWLTRPQHRHAFIFFFQYVHIQYNMAIMRHKLYRICGEESIWRRKRKKKIKLGGSRVTRRTVLLLTVRNRPRRDIRFGLVVVVSIYSRGIDICGPFDLMLTNSPQSVWRWIHKQHNRIEKHPKRYLRKNI